MTTSSSTARTGFSDEAGICTRNLADHLMILTGLNRQNVEGTCQFLMALRSATGGKKRFQIILSPVPNGEDALLEAREAEARRSFEEAWGLSNRSFLADTLPPSARAYRGAAHIPAPSWTPFRSLS